MPQKNEQVFWKTVTQQSSNGRKQSYVKGVLRKYRLRRRDILKQVKDCSLKNINYWINDKFMHMQDVLDAGKIVLNWALVFDKAKGVFVEMDKKKYFSKDCSIDMDLRD
jgi:hypothetical protein